MPAAHNVQTVSLVAVVPTVPAADERPALQFSHAVAVALATHFPAAHWAHPVVAVPTAAAPAAANFPSVHNVHAVAAAAAVLLPPPNVDERPAPQLMHVVAAASVHFPAAQLAQTAPAPANLPCAHAAQSVSLVAAVPAVPAADDRPALQSSHAIRVLLSTYFPAAQSLHAANPVVNSMNFPSGQLMHVTAAVCPAAAPYLPATHAIPLHAVAPSTSEYVPTAQLVHAPAASAENFPVSQSAHTWHLVVVELFR